MKSELEELFAEQLTQAGETTFERECKEPYQRATAENPRSRPRADFCWRGEKVVVEVEGGTWVRGGHSRGKGFDRDVRKHNFATLDGWSVLRVTTDMIKRSQEGLERTLELLQSRRLESTPEEMPPIKPSYVVMGPTPVPEWLAAQMR